jgi:cobalt-zinc-cadmium efflux system membrane fusion protein
LLFVLLTIVGIICISLSYVGRPAAGGAADGAKDIKASPPATPASAVRLLPTAPDTVEVASFAARSLQIEVLEAQSATRPRTLQLQGSLALNTNQLARVHSRFAGEVIEVSPMADNVTPSDGKDTVRPITFGDIVRKGQLLTVVWCKDLGEKKSELADAFSQLNFDQEQLAKMSDAAKEGAISEARLRQQERNVESDLTAVARAERTLRVWRLPEIEIQGVEDEAQRIRQRKGRRDSEIEKRWARVEVLAPMDGVIVEKNVSVGDIIDTTSDLFKIANVDTLTVWANAYEESLPVLLDLPLQKRQWSVQLNADPAMPPLRGRIEKVGYVSDPAQHTVMVMGQVQNPGGRLRAGQFITATVELPPAPKEVIVPAGALVDDGRDAVIFVQSNTDHSQFSIRHVAVASRSQKEVHLRSALRPEELSRGLRPVVPGERVVASGAIELQSAMDDLTSSNKATD